MPSWADWTRLQISCEGRADPLERRALQPWHHRPSLMDTLHMKLVVALCAALLASGCSNLPWHERQGVLPAAQLRVTSALDGNTTFATSKALDCSYEGLVSRLGWFHPGADQGLQASQRGFDRRVNMPGGESLPSHLFAETLVDAGQPLYVWVTNVGATGGGFVAPGGTYISAYQQSMRVAGFTPKAGQAYEVRYANSGGELELQLFTVSQPASGPAARAPAVFDLGSRKC